MLEDLVTIQKERKGTPDFLISGKIIDELYAMHEVINPIPELLKDFIQNQIKNNIEENENYYDELRTSILERLNNKEEK